MESFFRNNRVIAAIRTEDELHNCLESSCAIVFLLFGTILTVPEYVDQLKRNGKTVFVHIDLIEGLSSGRAAAEYVCHRTKTDGVISIKQNSLKYCKKAGLKTILRVFMVDSRSLEGLEKMNTDRDIDFIELMPGIALTEIRDRTKNMTKELIGGGLIRSMDSAERIIASGAAAVSTSNKNLWCKNTI
jgi:glycerol-3-phosphate responsive antiterminator